MTSADEAGPRKRKEQQRAAEAKEAIISASLAEFGERGFEGASIRTIAARTGIKHQLITYYFPSKELLWEAVAAHVYEVLEGARREMQVAEADQLSALELLRREFMAYFRFSVAHPHFHQFMVQKNCKDGARLEWMAEKFLRPHFALMKPLIRAAQKAGDLPKGEPVMLYYALVSMANTLVVMGPDMAAITGLDATSTKSVKAFSKLMDAILFRGGF
jgi:AcrR family transcriptional regulator